jgi:phage gp45-like
MLQQLLLKIQKRINTLIKKVVINSFSKDDQSLCSLTKETSSSNILCRVLHNYGIQTKCEDGTSGLAFFPNGNESQGYILLTPERWENEDTLKNLDVVIYRKNGCSFHLHKDGITVDIPKGMYVDFGNGKLKING